MNGILYIVGIGPGNIKYMTEEAIYIINECDIIVGYKTYIDILKVQFPNKYYYETGMTKELDRCKKALELAVSKNNVAVISSGDSGIYGMAGICIELNDKFKYNVDIEIASGITSAVFSASRLGAPLMNDFAVISLSDLMTPIDVIYKRIESAVLGDFVICFYNPKSKKRANYLENAVKIILKHRSNNTVVGIVRNAGRKDETKIITKLSEIDYEKIDMFCTVIIGNSQTCVIDNKMVTRRGYKID